MKKIFVKIILLFAVAAAAMSCGKFEPGGTSAQNISGDWVCTVYEVDGSSFTLSDWSYFQTYNTAENDGTIWIDDFEGYWGTYFQVDGSNSTYSFGKAGKEYEDLYNGTGQMIWGGKVTPNGAVTPLGGHVTDKIEFFIAFADDSTPYAAPYYVVGYLQTGFVDDLDEEGEYVPKVDWDLPAVPAVPEVTEPLE